STGRQRTSVSTRRLPPQIKEDVVGYHPRWHEIKSFVLHWVRETRRSRKKSLTRDCRCACWGQSHTASPSILPAGRKKAMDLLTTLPGSLMEGWLPRGWDLEKIDRLGALGPAELVRREP